MFVLYLTTSSTKASVGLEDRSTATFQYRESESLKGHSDFIFMAIRDLMQYFGVGASDISSIVGDHGPGSFTGVRATVSLARTWSLAKGTPVVLIKSFYAIKSQLAHHECVVLNAFRNALYVLFPNQGPCYLTTAEFTQRLDSAQQCWDIYGYGLEFYQMVSSIEARGHRYVHRLPHVDELRSYWLAHQSRVLPVDWREVTPFYLSEWTPVIR